MPCVLGVCVYECVCVCVLDIQSRNPGSETPDPPHNVWVYGKGIQLTRGRFNNKQRGALPWTASWCGGGGWLGPGGGWGWGVAGGRKVPRGQGKSAAACVRMRARARARACVRTLSLRVRKGAAVWRCACVLVCLCVCARAEQQRVIKCARVRTSPLGRVLVLWGLRKAGQGTGKAHGRRQQLPGASARVNASLARSSGRRRAAAQAVRRVANSKRSAYRGRCAAQWGSEVPVI